MSWWRRADRGTAVDPTDPAASTAVHTAWRISGTYFESCNCDAVCPCRMVGDVKGGRSTHGICYGVLTWAIEQGWAGNVELSGLAAALVLSYDDDEPGSPWTFVVHVDERGSAAQRSAIVDILTGNLGGEQVLRLPWVSKPSNLVQVRSSPIEIAHEGAKHTVHVGRAISLAAHEPVPVDARVACGIAGYDQPGTELYADAFLVDDAPFAWELSGNCAFTSAFDYRSR